MKIYIPSITFRDHPLIWDYDPESNKAQCLLTLIGIEKPYEYELLIAQLQKIQGIYINEKEAWIHNAKHFFSSHPMHLIDSSQSRTETTTTTTTSSLEDLGSARTKPGFFKSGLLHRPLSFHWAHKSRVTPDIKIACVDPQWLSASRSLISLTKQQPINDIRGIYLDTLINKSPACSSIWGTTLCYENYFPEKLRNASLARSKLIHSMISIMSELQYTKNNELYPIKQEQIRLIRQLFDKVLAPFYGNQHTSPTLLTYFQKVITDVMNNTRFNSGPTEYENLSEAERNEKFDGNTSLFQFAVLEARRARARIMLRPLLFFLSNDIKSHDLSESPEIVHCLEGLKQSLQSEREQWVVTNKLLTSLEELIVQVGQVEYHFNLIEKACNVEEKTRNETVNNQFSCYYLVIKALDTKISQAQLKSKLKDSKTKEADIQHITREVIKTVIASLKVHDSIAKLHKDINNDFYFSSAWAYELKLDLMQRIEITLSSKKFAKTSHNRQIQELVNDVAEEIMTFIDKKLLALSLEKAEKHSEESVAELLRPY